MHKAQSHYDLGIPLTYPRDIRDSKRNTSEISQRQTGSLWKIHCPDHVLKTHEDCLNPLVPDAHYSERQDKPASLQNKLLEDNRW